MTGAALQTSQLFRACHVLFGPEISASLDFIRYLQLPGLKAAFRKKALETHPDRAVLLALQAPDLERRFKEVHAAYRDLSDYLENPLKFRLIHDVPQKPRPGQKGRTRGQSSDWSYEKYCHTFSGRIVPERELLFGRYLFYHGLISYKHLIDAIVWQKIQRPAVGKLALRWRWLHDADVTEILRRRRVGEKFGECALRCEYLTDQKIRALLSRQRFLQPRIGKYFVEKGILSTAAVETMAEKLRQHNWHFRGR